MRLCKNTLAVAVLLAFAVGCIPEKRIIWSPDGRTAAVCAERGGLFFINSEGKVLPPRLEATAARAAWFQDGKRLAIVHSQEAAAWAGVAPIFSTDELDAIKAASQVFRARALAYNGPWEKFELDPEGKLSPGDELAVLLYTRDQNADGLAAKMGKEWAELGKITARIWQLQLCEFTPEQLVPGKVLVRTLDELRQHKVAPDQRNIAFLRTAAESDGGDLALFVIPLQGADARQVAGNVAVEYDWSRDGRSLAYIHSTSRPAKSDSTVQLGSLATITVADANGALLQDFAERNDRVGLLFNPLLQVKWLADGRLLFSSVEVTLPATTRDMPQQWSLFILDPRMPAGVTRVLARDFPEPLETGCPLFELSPDETKVLLAGPKGRVYLYDFAAGKTVVIQGQEDPEGKIRSLPSWRTPTEVTCVAPRSQGEPATIPARVISWRDGQIRDLSADWPDAMREGWLTGG